MEKYLHAVFLIESLLTFACIVVSYIIRVLRFSLMLLFALSFVYSFNGIKDWIVGLQIIPPTKYWSEQISFLYHISFNCINVLRLSFDKKMLLLLLLFYCYCLHAKQCYICRWYTLTWALFSIYIYSVLWWCLKIEILLNFWL